MIFPQANSLFFPLAVFFTATILTAGATTVFGQSRKVVMRSTSISDEQPITNVTITNEGFAWVGNKDALYQAFDMDLVTPLEIGPDELSVAQLPDGNVDFRLQKSAVSRLVGGDQAWSCAYYDERREALYLGTEANGVFVLSVEPELRVVEHLTSRSSRLKSDRIRNMMMGRDGRIWIGTAEGVLVGNAGKWKLMESDLDIDGISQNASETWVVAFSEVFFVDEKDDWYVYELPSRAVEGQIKDIAWDTRGNLWILSQVITEYSVEQEQAVVYGPADYFTSEYATRIEAGADGRVWVGTNDKGVYLLDKAALLAVDLQIDKPLGCDASKKDAALAARISGGVPPYTLAWSDGLSGEKPSGLGPGLYTLTVTDDKGMSRVAEISIEDNSIQVTAEQTANASEPGAADAKAEVSVSGGEEPYTVEWDNGEKGYTALQLTEGVRKVIVTDARGCSVTASVTIRADLLPLAAEIEQSSLPRCFGEQSGAIRVKAQGGKAPYNYKWSDNTLQGAEVDGLGSGIYSVTISDASGLSQVLEYELADPQKLEVVFLQEAPASSYARDGQAFADASGGTPPFTYLWSDGTRNARAKKLLHGNHSVTVTDANGCTATAAGVISEDILPLEVSIELVRPLTCFEDRNGEIRVVMKGGKTPYNYKWSDNLLSSTDLSKLGVGTYTITVNDATGETKTAEIELTAPPPLSAQLRQEAPATANGNDGRAIVEVSGGTPPYTYTWSNGSSSARVDDLSGGATSVTVSDANGCTAIAETDIREDILPLQAEIEAVTPLKCFGETNGELRVVLSGGKTPYRFVWDQPSLDGPEGKNLSAGTYKVTVSDASGLTRALEYRLKAPENLEVDILQEAPASANGNDGRAFANTKGGTPPYTYQWDNGTASARAENLDPGRHQVTVTDANGCSRVEEVQISENIMPLNAQLELISAVRCAGQNNGEIQVNISGGKTPFVVNWNANGSSDLLQSNLPAGDYQVTVTDASGQSAEDKLTLTQPEPLEVTIENVKRSRLDDTPDGQAEAIVQGGVKPYTFKWDNGEDIAQASKLLMGMHTLTVTDNNGCSATATAEIKKRIIPELSAGLLSEGQTIRIQQLQFDADSTKINESSKPVLFEVAEFLGENPEIVVEIGGHTNGIPEHEYCDWLSTERAKSVADFIVNQGIDGRRVYYKGYGKRKPVASNFTEEGRSLNQRVEIKVLAVEGE